MTHAGASATRPRPIPDIKGFVNRPAMNSDIGGMTHCWDLECRGGRVKDVIEWLREHRPHFKTRVTAIVRTHRSTWIVDLCEENVRITHFRYYEFLWMSERMKLWWRERKEKETVTASPDVGADREVQRGLSIMRQIGHMWPVVDWDNNRGGAHD
jgi:hypothetical protein